MLDLLIVLMLAVINGLFSMSEIAIVSARRARLQNLAEGGSAGAQTAITLAENPTRFLSSVQIGITLIGILSGTFGGATVAKDLAAQLGTLPLLAPYSQTLSVILVVALITYLSLVVGELVPKRIGLQNPERIAAAVARPMALVSHVAAPLISFLSVSTELLLRLLGVHPSSQPAVTAEEVKALMREGMETGIFPRVSQEMVSNVFRLDEMRVTASMTPRPEIVWLEIDDTLDELRAKICEHPFTAFPVYGQQPDNVLGLVRAKDLLKRFLSGEGVDLKTMLQEPLFVPEAVTARRALELLRLSGAHLALIIGEHGDVEGLVTIRDLLEEVVDVDQENATQRADGSWLLEGMMPIEELKTLLDIEELPAEENYQTVGGFVMAQLGHIPKTTDAFVWNNFRFEVVDMDNRRVDKVLVDKIAV
ncbi:MAG: HlyC/CorC family transporter [Chloroflexi bacterium]|nr:HlyC/CorC family transporter [Chloroflexota bacterium]